MSVFCEQLASRLVSHDTFHSALSRLERAGVVATLPASVQSAVSAPNDDDLAKLLYSASVFAQTNQESWLTLAQSIALNALLIDKSAAVRERALQILLDVGNFPGLTFLESKTEREQEPLLSLIDRKLSEVLHAVRVGPRTYHLMDYQQQVWDSLPVLDRLAISAPTSAGKSFLVIEHMCRLAETRDGFIGIYIAPTRALLGEVLQKIQSRLSAAAGIRITSVPSEPIEPCRSQILVLTQERLHIWLNGSTASPSLVIVDEAQNLRDSARGMILHECLQLLANRAPAAQVVFIAPAADGLPEVARLVGLGDMSLAATTVSPVIQNRIVVQKVKGEDALQISLLGREGVRHDVGILSAERGLDNKKTRLAAVALELGSNDGSLVYATGPAEAEEVAVQLTNGCSVSTDPTLEELSEFIREHVHEDYQLAAMVRHGVGFHYGRMPSLLREALEESFKKPEGGLNYLVCTTTLFQGINLPARNVFISTPTRGRKGEKLDPAMLWNFAGRAGRLSQDVVGNVFLVDYDEWSEKPLDSPVRFNVSSAFSDVLRDEFSAVLEAVDGKMPGIVPGSDRPRKIRACAGWLIAKATDGEFEAHVARIAPDASTSDVAQLVQRAMIAHETVGLPQAILDANWTIDPFGMRRLLDRMLEKVAANEVDELIPLNPHEPDAKDSYSTMFSRILKYVYGNASMSSYAGLVASLAIPWMKGVPYPLLLKQYLGFAQRRQKRLAEAKGKDPRPISVDSQIRNAFDLIETVVRFEFVQLGAAYVQLLNMALLGTEHEAKLSKVYDFSLALELGVSTITSRSFVELGLSRITAARLEEIFPDSKFSVSDARAALYALDLKANRLSPIMVDELRRLNLIPTLAAA